MPIPMPSATLTVVSRGSCDLACAETAVDDGRTDDRTEDAAAGILPVAVAPSTDRVDGNDDRVASATEPLDVGASVILEEVRVVAEGSDCRM